MYVIHKLTFRSTYNDYTNKCELQRWWIVTLVLLFGCWQLVLLSWTQYFHGYLFYWRLLPRLVEQKLSREHRSINSSLLKLEAKRPVNSMLGTQVKQSHRHKMVPRWNGHTDTRWYPGENGHTDTRWYPGENGHTDARWYPGETVTQAQEGKDESLSKQFQSQELQVLNFNLGLGNSINMCVCVWGGGGEIERTHACTNCTLWLLHAWV